LHAKYRATPDLKITAFKWLSLIPGPWGETSAALAGTSEER
jgi:hypothetical protein